ncbi:hypothetical protein BDR26DRAFT_867307 [Obelidium mucronatum]|nr:hypothetical protein BDR26DRAFT_867307 [Obelidium mucronatum]
MRFALQGALGLLFLAFIPSVFAQYQDPEKLGLYFDAKLNPDGKTATITMSGTLPAKQSWIGFGIADPASPSYFGAELYLAMPNQQTAGIKFVHGSGRFMLGGSFGEVVDPLMDPETVVNYTASYYNEITKTIHAVFTRPLNPSSNQIPLNTDPPMVSVALTTRNATYLYATGPLSSEGVPLKCVNRGISYNVTLFGDQSGNGLKHLAQTSAAAPRFGIYGFQTVALVTGFVMLFTI